MDGETRTKHTDDDALARFTRREGQKNAERRMKNNAERRTTKNEEQRRMKNNEERTNKTFYSPSEREKRTTRVPYPKKPHFIHLQKAKKRLPKETSQGRCCYYLLSIVIALCTPQLFVRQ